MAKKISKEDPQQATATGTTLWHIGIDLLNASNEIFAKDVVTVQAETEAEAWEAFALKVNNIEKWSFNGHLQKQEGA